MAKILIICSEPETNRELTTLLADVGYETFSNSDESASILQAQEICPDITIIDTSSSKINASNICKCIKLQNTTNDTQIILLTSEDSSSEEVLVGADGYITRPFNENILIATINAHLRIKKLLDILYTNNSELAKSLYQLNVLYSISSQLAGTLDKSKLISIMNTGLEKSLNFSLCYALVINEPEDATLIINSLYPVSDRLEQALKLRALVGYKSLFEDGVFPFELSISNINVEKNHKEPDSLYDLDILVWDRLFSPINTADQFFGIVEIIRESDFSGEDSTCFQTVVKQVSPPLESALFYEEIRKTNLKLEKLERLKSEFISIVSHELRTPITSIKNSLDLILTGRTGEITDVQNNFLSLAKRNVDRLSGIINDLLDLSKIEAGKMEYRFEPCNILEPLSFVVSTLDNLANRKNIALALESDSDEIKIYGDAGKIEQVVSNLVSNAIKFTEENGQITIKAEKTGDIAKISVRDSGIGIKEDDITRIFDKFHQIESSLNRKAGGTGLGLPIARQLIEAHRGKIWAESEPGKGSVFSFEIPLFQEDNSFLFEVDNALQRAKYNHSGFALVFIETQNPEKIRDTISEKGLVSRHFLIDNILKVILPDIDRGKTQNLLEQLKDIDRRANIGHSVYPEDGITSEELMEKAGNLCKKQS